MINETKLSRSIRLICLGGMTLGMHAAYAQEAATEAAPQKIEVTGSRIPSLSVDGPSPVTVLSAKDIKIDGVRNVEDMLNNLPQVFADQGSAVSNGATGTATVSLRNLGPDRTLVLVNGKRLPAGSVSSSAADLNEIPGALIKRVDILTGGAGAVYGAGAVAGVVNFILKDNFEGVEVQVNRGGYNHSQHNDPVSAASEAHGYPVPGNATYDGKSKDASILMGGNFAEGKGNATLFFSYKETNPLLQSQRDFTSCAIAPKSKSGGGYLCSGSDTNANGLVQFGNDLGYTNADANGTARVYNAATDAYNFGPLNYLQRPAQNYNLNAQAHFDINDKVRVYQEFGFHNYSTKAQIAPGGIFNVGTTLSIDNPYLSQSWKDALGLTAANPTVDAKILKRNVEGGPRIDSISDTSFREVLGVKGEINNFTYDVFAQFARVTHQETSSGYFSVAKIGDALDAVTDPKTGLPVCRSGTTGCVPYNVFTKGGVTQAMLDYLQVSGHQQGYTQQIVYGGNVSTDLGRYGVKTPWTNNGVGVSLGVEHRAEHLTFEPDQENISGDLSGGGGAAPPIDSGYSVKEVFGEVHVPLVEKMPFVESLELSGSYRHSEYSSDKTANTYGVGLDWGITKQVRLRGSYQRAVRAPTIQDLYNPQSIGNGGPSNDPCANQAESGKPLASFEQCAHTGVTAAQYGNLRSNSAGQYSSLTGGNPDLAPEVADTYTVGLVLQPIKDLTFTIDGFLIDIKNTISTISPDVALNQCLDTGNPLYCNLVKRDGQGSLWQSPNGPLGYVVATNANIGSLSTSGVDVGANYRYKTGSMGVLDFTMNGTWTKEFRVENVPGLGTYDCKGLFGPTCGTPTPAWKHKFRTTWSTPWQLEVSGTWRHTNHVKSEFLSGNELLGKASQSYSDETALASRDYFDLNLSYPLTKQIQLSGGINNLFDKDPPIVSTKSTAAAGLVNGNTYPQVYDSLGRFIYINMTARF